MNITCQLTPSPNGILCVNMWTHITRDTILINLLGDKNPVLTWINLSHSVDKALD